MNCVELNGDKIENLNNTITEIINFKNNQKKKKANQQLKTEMVYPTDMTKTKKLLVQVTHQLAHFARFNFHSFSML